MFWYAVRRLNLFVITLMILTLVGFSLLRLIRVLIGQTLNFGQVGKATLLSYHSSILVSAKTEIQFTMS